VFEPFGGFSGDEESTARRLLNNLLEFPVTVPMDILNALEFREDAFLEIGGGGFRQPYMKENVLPAWY
jgi:hypothetical protein